MSKRGKKLGQFSISYFENGIETAVDGSKRELIKALVFASASQPEIKEVITGAAKAVLDPVLMAAIFMLKKMSGSREFGVSAEDMKEAEDLIDKINKGEDI